MNSDPFNEFDGNIFIYTKNLDYLKSSMYTNI